MGAKLPRGKVQLLHIGHRRLIRLGMIGSLFIGTPGQSGKALFFKDEGNIGGAERLALVVEDSLNVINGKVLLAGPDNLLAQGIGFGTLLRAFSRGEEKGRERFCRNW